MFTFEIENDNKTTKLTAWKSGEGDRSRLKESTADYRSALQKLKNFGKWWLNERMIVYTGLTIFLLFCRFFSKKPHVAGSPRQKELADELEKRWKDYGFDKVEKPEYKALLSFPDTENPTRITIKYKNGSIIHQIKGEEQVINMAVNPLSPNSDQHQFSPNNIHRLSSATSMRINQMITNRKISDLLSISPN